MACKTTPKFMNRVNWLSLQKELLEKERLAEVEASTVQVGDVALKQLEAKGIAISRLTISETSTGLFGQPTVTLVPRRQQGVIPSLPSHSFSSGDIVGIWECGGNNKGQLTSGVVSKLTSSSIQIALDEDTPELDQLPDDALFRVHKLANDVTYRRIRKGLEELEKMVRGPSSHLIEVLFMETTPYEPLPQLPTKVLQDAENIQLFNKNLDASQVDAVKFALLQKDLAVVHGPPGTGKTTTLVEIILQHVKLGCKVLAVAPSNLAVDNLLERLVENKVSLVRVGHPARATLKAQQKTLDAQIQYSEDNNLIQDIHKDIKASLQNLSKTKEKGKRFRIKDEIKNFRKELREREKRLSKEILARSQVVLTTLTSAGNAGPLKLLPEEHFDLTVIDECSQGLECACYLSAVKAPKLLIAGDHQQLPPTILSTEAAKQGFLVSLMERVIEMYKDRVTRMLKTQYRMNSVIMDWASEALYEKQLIAHPSVGSHLLCHMEGVETNEDTENALVLIDTAGCHFEEVSGEDLSKGNEGESVVVAEHVKRLIGSGVKEKDVAVISPYNLQVEMVRSLLRESYPNVEIRSVDGFQGREKEAVILSLVRSNKQGEIGFLSEDRRLNVAVTRARRQLTLVGDTDTVCRHAFIRGLVDHITANGIVKSGHEFEDETGAQQRHSFNPAPLQLQTGKSKDSQKKKNPNQKNEKGHKKPHSEGVKKPPLSEEEAAKKRQEYEARIAAFINSSETSSLEFPRDLNSFERMLVHDIAEKQGLIHESQGEGKERFITLRKRPLDSEGDGEEKSHVEASSNGNKVERDKEPVEMGEKEEEGNVKNESKEGIKEETKCNNELKQEQNVTNKSQQFQINGNPKAKAPPTATKSKNKKHKENSFPESESINTESEHVGMTKSINSETQSQTLPDKAAQTQPLPTKKCEICLTEVTVRNFELHLLRCERLRKEKSIKDAINKRKTEIKGVKKKKTDGKPQEKEEDDFEIMKKYAKENNSCAYPRCKNPSILLLQLCSFCRNNFCLKHHQAEIHGCGEEAKKHARTVLIQSVRNGVLTPGSGVISKKPDPVKRGQLQRKLDKKLGDLGDQRKTKKKDK